MARYSGPKGRINRRLQTMVYESAGAVKAFEKRGNQPPGMHTRFRRPSTYGAALAEKQKIKHYYVNSPRWRQQMIVWGYIGYNHVYNLVWLRKNSVAEARSYNPRGMSWYYDAVDWVGGYPFEFASVEEITAFCENELAMTTLKAVDAGGHGCNEFLFRAKE